MFVKQKAKYVRISQGSFKVKLKAVNKYKQYLNTTRPELPDHAFAFILIIYACLLVDCRKHQILK